MTSTESAQTGQRHLDATNIVVNGPPSSWEIVGALVDDVFPLHELDVDVHYTETDQRYWAGRFKTNLTDQHDWPSHRRDAIIQALRRHVEAWPYHVTVEVEHQTEQEQLPSAEEVVSDLEARLQELQEENKAKNRELSEARAKLQESVNDAIEDGIQSPDPEVLDRGAELLALVSPECYKHDVENHVTQDRDVVTDILDSEDNYVMMKSRADGTAAVHFNICGYEEYERGEPADEAFILKLVHCLTKEDATA